MPNPIFADLPRFDDDIWEDVQKHAWKYRPRTKPIRFVELHCTRSGIAGRTPLNEYHATMNWSLSTGNRNIRQGDDWASMESFICGGGKVCRVLVDNVYPHYSLGHADPEAVSIEIGQNLDGAGFDQRDLEHAAQICAHFVQHHGVANKVLAYLSADNHEGSGFVRHDRSANGDYYGKSDPGKDFDDRAFEAMVAAYLPQEDSDMTFIGRAKDDDAETPYKTYMLFVSSDGELHKRHIPDAETAAALEAAGIPLRTMSKQELARYRDA